MARLLKADIEALKDLQEEEMMFLARDEDGVKAYKHLLFENGLYKDKTISSAISTYAPPSENNTGAYIQEAMKGIPGEYRNIKMKDCPEKWKNKLMENMFRVEDSGGGYKEVQIGKVEN